jgi:tetratricopeptide (TPR) repeat protein
VLRVVGAYRDTEVRPADLLGLLVADLAQARLARHHVLGPLRAEEAATLLDNLLHGAAGGDRAVAESVLERAGGTPFFLVSYAQALRTGAGGTVPWDLAQGVRQRVALLPAAGHEILGAAAIVGRRAPRALLLAATGQPEEEALAGLEAACRARLLLEEGADAYAFAHDVIREVVEADVGAARRAVLHCRVAQALEHDPAGAPPELLAYHYACGGAPDKAVPYLEQAGDQAWAQRAHGAAESHYRAVLDRWQALGRAQEAVRVREKLGEVLYQTGCYGAALQVLEPAADAFRATSDLTSLGRVAARIGWAHALGGTPHEGLARLTPLLWLLEQDGASSASALAALYAAWGELLFAAGEYETCLAASERAATLARAGGDDRIRAQAHFNCMNILQTLGRLGDALKMSQEVLPLAEAVGDRESLLWALIDRAYIHAQQGTFAASRHESECALPVARQMEDPGLIAYALAHRGWIISLGGDWPGARAALDEAVALSRQAHLSWYSPYPLILRARLSLAVGDWADATAALQEALTLAERSADLQARRRASTVMAELDVLEGRPEAAGARLGPLLDREGLQECDVTALLPVLAWAQLEQDQAEQAAAVVGQALVRARREDMRLVLVEALRVQALIALRHERWEEATRSLEEGLALARGMPYPYAEARLLQLYGYLRVQKGELEAARDRLAAALALFRRLGARTDMALAEQALRTLPGTPPGAAALHAMAALSPRDGGAAASPASARLSRPQRQAWVLERLRADGPLSPRAYARALAISVDTALLDLRELVGRGLVRAEGTTKDRRYVLAGDDRS